MKKLTENISTDEYLHFRTNTGNEATAKVMSIHTLNNIFENTEDALSHAIINNEVVEFEEGFETLAVFLIVALDSGSPYRLTLILVEDEQTGIHEPVLHNITNIQKIDKNTFLNNRVLNWDHGQLGHKKILYSGDIVLKEAQFQRGREQQVIEVNDSEDNTFYFILTDEIFKDEKGRKWHIFELVEDEIVEQAQEVSKNSD